MMEVTKSVIEDLLPLYLAGEASVDTRKLVDEYLQRDPELKRMAEEGPMMRLPKDIPMSLTREDKMTAYKEAKRLMFLRTIILTGIVSSLFIVVFLVSILVFKVM